MSRTKEASLYVPQAELEEGTCIPLLATKHSLTYYNIQTRWFFRNREHLELLATMRGIIFSYLIQHPTQVLGYASINYLVNPNAPYPTNKEELNNLRDCIVRPTICHIRDVLRRVHPELPRTIQTVHSDGYFYIPHPTVVEMPRLPASATTASATTA